MSFKIGPGFFKSFLFSSLAIIAILIPAMFHLGRLNLMYSIIFLWLLADPQKMTFSVIFVLSLLQDLLNHSYLGAQASLYAVFMIFLLSQRRQLMNRSFLLTWVAFATSLFALMALKSFLGFIFYQQTLTLYEFVMEDIIPVLLFPLVFQACTFLNSKVSTQDA